ncbi:MAG: PAS domain S-box protein, partial [FCB group bacterium]|nr:PAS domain S-box protein [FCB group bacterium]
MEIDNRTKGELLDELNRLQLQVAQLESSKSIQHLQDEKTKFQSVIQTAPIIILRLSPDHRILEFNSEAERLYGYKREEVLGKDYLTLCIPEDIREEIARDIKKVLGGIPTREYENAVIAPDGQMRLLSWNVERILDSDNRPTGIVAVGLDVTAKMEKEKELAEARAFLQAAIEQTPAGVIIADAHEHKISVANSVARQMRAGDNEDVIGISIDDFQREVEVFDADGCRFRAEDFPMSRALRKGEATRDLEIKVCFRDREDLWILSNATPVRDTDNEIIGGVVVFSDITDRKRTEQVL